MYKRDFYIIEQNLKIKQSVDTWNSKFQKTITCNYTDFDTDIINNQVQERNNLIL